MKKILKSKYGKLLFALSFFIAAMSFGVTSAFAISFSPDTDALTTDVPTIICDDPVNNYIINYVEGIQVGGGETCASVDPNTYPYSALMAGPVPTVVFVESTIGSGETNLDDEILTAEYVGQTTVNFFVEPAPTYSFLTSVCTVVDDVTTCDYDGVLLYLPILLALSVAFGFATYYTYSVIKKTL